ncbi:SDR family NAD(P)-dependent oxidoreductase [Occultella kanbiaonis]|uniref:SDR family NAD(P)-dependent oxidoreductase n=1 Tax=Occultella kanbiaonis TaxID=2675754 RepID=UPI001F20B6B7|nr:SDR family NAD(P)-dependent oxidoreductase [Occultella kanbiaonis]
MTSAAGERSPLTGTAMVTGGTSGIGLAFARGLAGRGLDLVLVARDAARLESTAADLRHEFGVAVETLTADLAEPDGVAVAVARLTRPETPVTVLVNNAGHGVHTPLISEDPGPHLQAIDLMVSGVLVLGGAAGRAMSERGSGLIINVASVAGLIPMGSYSAIKAWVNAYSEGLGIELSGTGVRVMTLLPGWVRTEFHERAAIRTNSIPSVLWLDADRLVSDCLADVDRGRTRSVPSRRFKALAWGARHAPRPLVNRATALIKKGRR